VRHGPWIWEYQYTSRPRRALQALARMLRRPVGVVAIGLGGVYVGVLAGAGQVPGSHTAELAQLTHSAEWTLRARQGELALARIELARMHAIFEHSARNRVPADLAASIYDIARAEGVDPALAFSLVRVESGFVRGAVSSMGAVGLTQVMPATAFELDSRLAYEDLFERETNLRLGFRYLRQMIDRYEGNVALALLAYNRGPTRVDEIRSVGGDPNNGYARAVLLGQR
jgi:soluble lytic murein transglycosylase-like protein